MPRRMRIPGESENSRVSEQFKRELKPSRAKITDDSLPLSQTPIRQNPSLHTSLSSSLYPSYSICNSNMTHEVIKGQCERHKNPSIDPSHRYPVSIFFFFNFPFSFFVHTAFAHTFLLFFIYIALIDKQSRYDRSSLLASRCPCTEGNYLCRALPMAVTHTQNCLEAWDEK